MRCLISSSNAFSLSSCLHVSFEIQCHYLWKTLELYYTRWLATFILKTHVFHSSSNCKNIWKLFGVILNTGFDVFLYLRYGFTYRLLLFFWGGHNTWFLYTRPSGNPFWFCLWTYCDISWSFFAFSRNLYAFLMLFLCSSYAFLMHFLCNSFAFLMQFFCNSYAILLQFPCISYAFLMHFLCSSYAVLKTSYTFAKTAYTFAQNVWSGKNCIRIA